MKDSLHRIHLHGRIIVDKPKASQLIINDKLFLKSHLPELFTERKKGLQVEVEKMFFSLAGAGVEEFDTYVKLGEEHASTVEQIASFSQTFWWYDKCSYSGWRSGANFREELLDQIQKTIGVLLLRYGHMDDTSTEKYTCTLCGEYENIPIIDGGVTFHANKPCSNIDCLSHNVAQIIDPNYPSTQEDRYTYFVEQHPYLRDYAE